MMYCGNPLTIPSSKLRVNIYIGFNIHKRKYLKIALSQLQIKISPSLLLPMFHMPVYILWYNLQSSVVEEIVLSLISVVHNMGIMIPNILLKINIEL